MTEHAHGPQLIYTPCNECRTRTASLFPGTCNCSNRITHFSLPSLNLSHTAKWTCTNVHQIFWFQTWNLFITFSHTLFAQKYTALLSIPQWLSHYSWILVKLYQSHRFTLETDMQTPIWWHRLKSTFQNTMIVSEPLANNINPYICYPMENFRYSEKILAYFLSLQWYINKPSLLAESLKTKEVIFRLRPALD